MAGWHGANWYIEELTSSSTGRRLGINFWISRPTWNIQKTPSCKYEGVYEYPWANFLHNLFASEIFFPLVQFFSQYLNSCWDKIPFYFSIFVLQWALKKWAHFGRGELGAKYRASMAKQRAYIRYWETGNCRGGPPSTWTSSNAVPNPQNYIFFCS